MFLLEISEKLDLEIKLNMQEKIIQKQRETFFLMLMNLSARFKADGYDDRAIMGAAMDLLGHFGFSQDALAGLLMAICEQGTDAESLLLQKHLNAAMQELESLTQIESLNLGNAVGHLTPDAN